MPGEQVTVKLSRRTLSQLESLKRSLGARSIDEVVQRLIREYRARLIESIMGVDAGRLSGFTEEDRLEED